MKKVKRAAGRKEFTEAQRLYAHRPEYTLDHLVKERYPTFADALADLDDAVSMIHLFATLPSEKHIDPTHTALSKRLCREWQAYIAKSKGLRKVREGSFACTHGFVFIRDCIFPDLPVNQGCVLPSRSEW
jgi:pescadillo